VGRSGTRLQFTVQSICRSCASACSLTNVSDFSEEAELSLLLHVVWYKFAEVLEEAMFCLILLLFGLIVNAKMEEVRTPKRRIITRLRFIVTAAKNLKSHICTEILGPIALPR
jgi:hypothetical protein